LSLAVGKERVRFGKLNFLPDCTDRVKYKVVDRDWLRRNLMSEFLDFLRHEFAYVAIGEFKPGKFEAAEQLFEKAVATYATGFKGAYLLQLPNTDKGIAIIFWESVEEMAANQSEAYQAILKEMTPLFAKIPDTDIYEIVSEIKPKH
jgi:heme-degrading monooxygenase HmoA